MWIRTKCSLNFHLEEATPLILMLRPRNGLQQWIYRESYHMTPTVPIIEYTDNYGNICQRLVASANKFRIDTSADVMTMDKTEKNELTYFVEIPNLPDSILTFLYPSRFCESDRFGKMAREIVADAQPGYEQVEFIKTWISNSIQYMPGSSEYPESAAEVNMKGYGVCRDLAHLGISLCRSLSIPARLVVGYLHGLKPMDLHAWYEAYVGDRWYTFDPTQRDVRGGRVVIAYGRDAADVAVYTQFGPPAIYTSIDVSVELLNAEGTGHDGIGSPMFRATANPK